MRVVRILGVDPGSRLTGFGCVDLVGNQVRHVAHGTLRLSNTGGKAVIPLEQRLLLIYQGLSELIVLHRPNVMAIEKAFFAKNASSALKLGQARGAAIVCGAVHGLEIVEYSPSEVKASITGFGQADKTQVAKMVQLLTGASEFVTADASDGLAIALCHAHTLGSQAARPAAYRELTKPSVAGKKKRNLSLAEAVAHKLRR